MRRYLATAALAAATLVLAGTASATTTRACVDNNAPYSCRATTAETKATSAVVNAGRFSTATWRLTCTKGSQTSSSTGAISRRGRVVLIDWVGKADCALTARFRSSNGPRASGRVTLLTG